MSTISSPECDSSPPKMIRPGCHSLAAGDSGEFSLNPRTEFVELKPLRTPCYNLTSPALFRRPEVHL
jgi:hypothetical protein